MRRKDIETDTDRQTEETNPEISHYKGRLCYGSNKVTYKYIRDYSVNKSITGTQIPQNERKRHATEASQESQLSPVSPHCE